MKKFKTLLLSVAAFSILFSSCTIEKRVYLPGYNVQWHGSKKNIQHHKAEVKEVQFAQQSAQQPESNVATETKVSSPVLVSETNCTPAEATAPIAAQVNAKSKPAAATSHASHSRSEVFQADLKVGQFTKAAKHTLAKAPSGEKSQLVALLLCIFVGILGIHRFYLGYTTIGIIQLLTAGGLGVWTLIDLIRIIIGDLKPKNGDYAKTL